MSEHVYDVQLTAAPCEAVLPELLAGVAVTGAQERVLRTSVSGRLTDQGALYAYLRSLRRYGLEVVELLGSGPRLQVTVSGLLGPVLRTALEPCRTVSGGVQTLVRARTTSHRDLVDLLIALDSRGLQVDRISAVT